MDWRDVPSLASLRAFEAAARLHSLSAAARALNVTHAAIAQHVRALEDHFGVPLLVRAGQQMQPTDDGLRLAGALTEGFGTIAAAARDLRDRDNVRPLRIALTPSFAANWLMPRIGAFWAAHPDIQLELVPSTQIVDLRVGGFDIAIRYGRGDWPGVETEPLVSGARTVVAAPSLLARTGARSSGDLLDQHWLLEAGGGEERLWAATQGIDLARARVTEFDTGALALQAVVEGHGVSILPAAIAAREIELGRLVAVLEERDSPVAYHIVTRPDHVTQRLRRFVRWLRATARGAIDTP